MVFFIFVGIPKSYLVIEKYLVSAFVCHCRCQTNRLQQAYLRAFLMRPRCCCTYSAHCRYRATTAISEYLSANLHWHYSTQTVARAARV